jgi:hypothetical protein
MTRCTCKHAEFRCQCGHVAEWHYKLNNEGVPIFRDRCEHPNQPFLSGVVRCPNADCECDRITDPQPIGATRNGR